MAKSVTALYKRGFQLRQVDNSNHYYVVNLETGNIVGVCENPLDEDCRIYMTGDRVNVTDDGCGYICPGVSNPGPGTIAEIREDTDHFFRVEMDDGTYGWMKSARFKR